MAISELNAIRALVQRLDREVSAWLSGVRVNGRTLAVVQSSCKDLRAATLDDRSSFLVGVMERSLTIIERADKNRGDSASAESLVSAQIELLKSVWQLDAYLAVMASRWRNRPLESRDNVRQPLERR